RIFIENKAGERIDLAENGPGDVFGEISVLDGGPRTAGAEAVDEVEVLAIDREDLLGLISRHPHAAIDLLTVVGRRLRETDERLRSYISRNLNEEEEERLTLGQRLADRVASFGGSWTFIIFFSAVLVTWMGVNAFLLTRRPFDPYPFILL